MLQRCQGALRGWRAAHLLAAVRDAVDALSEGVQHLAVGKLPGVVRFLCPAPLMLCLPGKTALASLGRGLGLSREC